MLRRNVLMTIAAALAAAVPPRAAAAQPKNGSVRDRLVMQVTDADVARWVLALSNARNVQSELGRANVDIEIVVYGPGIDMLRMESVVGPNVAEALAAGVNVTACENTMIGQHLSRDDMLPAIGYVKAGVVRLMRRQQEGYAYVRP
jgi:intracellular sulfur oxidation DsrE/DsrF family protein